MCGKSNYNGGNGKGKNNWYIVPGKVIGNGIINYHGLEEDYLSAWGYEGDDWNNYYIGDDHGNYYIGNAAMLMERMINNEDAKTNKTTMKPDEFKLVTGRRNALTGTLEVRPVTVQNSFIALQDNNDSDDDDDHTEHDSTTSNASKQTETRRQRRRR